MPKWTLDKELEDTSKAAGSGFMMSELAKKKKAKSSASGSLANADSAANPGGMSNADVEGGVLYKRGGYVPARASGKRMYAKGGMVKGKCS